MLWAGPVRVCFDRRGSEHAVSRGCMPSRPLFLQRWATIDISEATRPAWNSDICLRARCSRTIAIGYIAAHRTDAAPHPVRHFRGHASRVYSARDSHARSGVSGEGDELCASRLGKHGGRRFATSSSRRRLLWTEGGRVAIALEQGVWGRQAGERVAVTGSARVARAPRGAQRGGGCGLHLGCAGLYV
ncbi:hypothetical protein BC628DRAFT_220248 [Trametes gibbosa]|nr:hypothetical protein BC628DRAFT_220248 [Trametes gibbosa]